MFSQKHNQLSPELQSHLYDSRQTFHDFLHQNSHLQPEYNSPPSILLTSVFSLKFKIMVFFGKYGMEKLKKFSQSFSSDFTPNNHQQSNSVIDMISLALFSHNLLVIFTNSMGHRAAIFCCRLSRRAYLLPELR